MTQAKTPNMTDYEAERRNFSLEVPEYFNFAIDVIGKWAQDPNKLAMLWVGSNNEIEQVTLLNSLSVPAVQPMPLPARALSKANGCYSCCHAFLNGGKLLWACSSWGPSLSPAPHC